MFYIFVFRFEPNFADAIYRKHSAIGEINKAVVYFFYFAVGIFFIIRFNLEANLSFIGLNAPINTLCIFNEEYFLGKYWSIAKCSQHQNKRVLQQVSTH